MGTAVVAIGPLATGLTVTFPVDSVVGDLMLVHRLGFSTVGDHGSVPGGWDVLELASVEEGGGGNPDSGHLVMSKFLDASDVSAGNCVFAGSPTYFAARAIRVRFGKAATLPQSNDGSGATTITVGTVTPTDAGSVILLLASAYTAGASRTVGTYAITTSDPGGWAELYDEMSNTNNLCFAAAWAERQPTTATGNMTMVGSGSENWIGFAVVIAQQPASPSPALPVISVPVSAPAFTGNLDQTLALPAVSISVTAPVPSQSFVEKKFRNDDKPAPATFINETKP